MQHTCSDWLLSLSALKISSQRRNRVNRMCLKALIRHEYPNSVVSHAATFFILLLLISCTTESEEAQSSNSQYDPLPKSVISRISDESLRDYIVTLVEKVAKSDSSSEAIGRLAMAYDANGFDDAAESAYRTTVTKYPNQFKWQYLFALRLQKNGDLESAIEVAEEAIKQNDAYPALYVRLGSWLLDRGQPAAANDAFARAVELGAGPAAELGAARSLLKLEDHSGALKILRSVVTRTSHPVAFRLLSDTWRVLGDEEKSREYLEYVTQAKSMWFDDPLLAEMREHTRGKGERMRDVELMLGSGLVDDALLALKALDSEVAPDFNLQYHYALAYFQKQAFDQSEQHLKRAIELEPVHYPSHLLLASLYQRRDDNVNAAHHLEHVVKIYPKLQIAHQELGFVRLRLGDTDGALESLEAAIALDSTAPNVHYYAGVILGERGSCDHAMRRFETALALDEHHEKARIGISECVRALAPLDSNNANTPNE